jgi:hypothetical protein
MKLDVPYKLIGTIDTSVTDAFLFKLVEDDWFVYDYRKPMGGMKDCNSIPLRHSSEYTTSTIREMPLFEKFKQELELILDSLKQFYNFNEYAAFISRLSPGGVIDLHQDGGEFLEQIHRLHIPLKTNPDCLYIVEDVALNMQVGNAYEIDNMRVHGVENKGNDYRIHLVVNLYPVKNTP